MWILDFLLINQYRNVHPLGDFNSCVDIERQFCLKVMSNAGVRHQIFIHCRFNTPWQERIGLKQGLFCIFELFSLFHFNLIRYNSFYSFDLIILTLFFEGIMTELQISFKKLQNSTIIFLLFICIVTRHVHKTFSICLKIQEG